MSEQIQMTAQVMPHILVVDDEPDIRLMISLCLQKGRFRVTTAENVAEACKILALETFDAIISDVMMPGEDGIAFLGRVHESWPEIPVILMTGHAQLQMAVNAIKNGAFDFICKPFDLDHLNKILRRAVNYRNLQRLEKNYRAELEAMVASSTAQLKESMAELDYARAALQRVATEKSTFMSTVSHEMRTPMNGIIGSLDLLAEEDLSGSAAEYLAMACLSADNMMTLINQMLSFNSLNFQGGAAPQLALLPLHPFLNAMVEEQQALFVRKKLTLSLQMADDLPQQIRTDREKLARLFEILLGNALKFTEQGSVVLTVSRMSSGEGAGAADEMLLFSLTDTGIGIPEGMLERIFEPFVQGDGSFSRRHEGVGLGLAIARQNALLLNGQLWAEHSPADGSRFNVTLKINNP